MRTQRGALLRGLFDLRSITSTIGLRAERVKFALKCRGQLDAGDPEPVILDLAFEFFAGGQRQRTGGFEDWAFRACAYSGVMWPKPGERGGASGPSRVRKFSNQWLRRCSKKLRIRK